MNPQLLKETITFDIAGLLHRGARKHEAAYRSGQYRPSSVYVQRTLVYLSQMCKWDMFVVFDGMDNPLKANERQRRDDADALRNEPLYIAMIVKICTNLGIPGMVAKNEADHQCRVLHPTTGRPASMIVTGDSDLLALGHTHVMIVDGWESETHRIYDMTAAGLAIVLQSNELHSNEMLMVRGYDRFGPRLLLEQERFAAATGNRLITFRRWYELLPDSFNAAATRFFSKVGDPIDGGSSGEQHLRHLAALNCFITSPRTKGRRKRTSLHASTTPTHTDRVVPVSAIHVAQTIHLSSVLSKLFENYSTSSKKLFGKNFIVIRLLSEGGAEQSGTWPSFALDRSCISTLIRKLRLK